MQHENRREKRKYGGSMDSTSTTILLLYYHTLASRIFIIIIIIILSLGCVCVWLLMYAWIYASVFAYTTIVLSTTSFCYCSKLFTCIYLFNNRKTTIGSLYTCVYSICNLTICVCACVFSQITITSPSCIV